jgi:hypothetical protein
VSRTFWSQRNGTTATMALFILAFAAGPVLAQDQPETNLKDRFLGQISMSGVTDGFHDRVDGFSS